MIWVLGYLDDIASDFSVLHRIPDCRQMRAAAFAAMAPRLAAYPGCVAAAIAAERGAAASPQGAPAVPAGIPPGWVSMDAGGESFESRMARARVLPAGQAEQAITGLMTNGT